MKLSRKIMSVATAALLCVSWASASTSIIWETTGSPPQFLRNSTDTAFLTGNRTATGYTVAGFIQLILVSGGVNSTYDGLNLADPQGEGGDDVVIDTAWVGKGTPSLGSPSPDGRFSTTKSYTSTGQNYVIRFFDTPSPDYATGLIPTTGNYNFLSGFTSTGNPTDTFSITSNISANVPVAVPEPGTLLMALLGVGVVVL